MKIHKMNPIIFYFSLFLLFTQWIRAEFDWDDIGAPNVVAAGRETFFVALPETETTKPSGICYKFDDSGLIRVNWKMPENWRGGGQLFLTRDGVGLVRIKRVPIEEEDKQEILIKNKALLEFYQKGKLVKSIPVKDIVDPGKLLAYSGVPCYFIIGFGCRLPPKLSERAAEEGGYIPVEELPQINAKLAGSKSEVFMFSTCQGEAFTYQASNGALLARWKLPTAKAKE